MPERDGEAAYTAATVSGYEKMPHSSAAFSDLHASLSGKRETWLATGTVCMCERESMSKVHVCIQ
jgi:hypothetical protein